MRQGVFNIGSFYAKDAHVDLTSLGMPLTNTREDALKAIGRAFIPFPDRTQEPGDLYVSGTGAVEAAPIKEPSVDANRLVAIDEFDATRAGRPDLRHVGVGVARRQLGRPTDPRSAPPGP